MGAERYATALASSDGGRMALTDWSIRREASVDFAYTDEQLEFKAKCRRFAAGGLGSVGRWRPRARKGCLARYAAGRG